MKTKRVPTLANLGENGLLDLLTRNWKTDARVTTGVGDDCAVLPMGKTHLLFKTDAIVEGVHFTKATPAMQIGRKALARALSDIAAMGGSPLAAVITLGFPADEPVARLRGIYRGPSTTQQKLAGEFKVNLVGGETTRARDLFLSIALLGECRGYQPVLRSTAQARDAIFVTGRLGATQARKHLTFTPRLPEGEWLARQRLATAMMDLSDGLGADLPRLARASRLSFQVDPAALPRSRGASIEAAWSDGEDYELLFTVQPSHAKTLKKKWPFATPLHCIGSMLPPGRDGAHAYPHGFDHFKQRGSHAGLRGKVGGAAHGG